jgi:hypothetical protein
MPYKTRLQEGQECKRKKPTYRVTNCHEYNQRLKKRGQISLDFPDGDLLSQFIDASPYARGVSRRTSSYRASYVELIYTFYRLFSLGMRQLAGYMEDYWKTLGLDIPVPSFGHLSDLFSKLDLFRAESWCSGFRHRPGLRSLDGLLGKPTSNPACCNLYDRYCVSVPTNPTAFA